MTENLLLKFIKNNTNSQEREEVISWIEKNPENQKKYNLLKADYVARTLKNFRAEEPQDIVDLPYNRNRKKLVTVFSIAASLALIVGLSFYYNVDNEEKITPLVVESDLSETTEIITRSNLREEIKLPDGSIVSLNANSFIKYPKVFNDSIREVVLKGEAFFDITHNKDKPFIVKTEEYDIRVLGTTFNVKSYPDDKLTETTLISGKVELSREKETPIILAPSQKAIFHRKEKKIEIEKVKVENALGWTSGKLIFNDTPLHQVVIDLERKYNIDIKIDSPELLDYKYTGTFDNLTSDEVLKLLIISSDIKYEKINQKIILSMK
ncbi:FecR family protein [Maribacter sp. 2210JD10-5]|uniref:FecR family protein n=1 Tax=Maribacter sp. 2210JD10-5 TaxID=3386272 RepID=UPI0039BCB036